MPTIYTWNVNGMRAALRNGFLDWLEQAQPDILCLQETKCCEGDIDPVCRAPKGYGSVWQHARKPGYSGVATYFRKEPHSVTTLGVPAYDDEGRVQVLEWPSCTVINAYFPNSQPDRKRLDYKLGFCEAIQEFCEKLRAQGRNVVLCGDINIAHQEIDLARPKGNENSPGFYIEERESMTRFLARGYVDAFRHFVKEPGHYTWWSYRSGARKKNIGWRIDYHLVNEELVPRLKESTIHCEVMGSDHCPVSLTLKR